MERWSIAESAKIYNLDNWGADLFSVNKKGNICVHPSSNSKNAIDLRALVDDLIKRKIKPPILLRFMDSFMIYTEVIVLTGGGPGSTTKFLSIDLVQKALGGFDLGPAAAFSIVYFLIILFLSWLFYTLMMRHEAK